MEAARPKAKAKVDRNHLPRYDQQLRAAKGRRIELVLDVEVPFGDDFVIIGTLQEIDTYDLGVLVDYGGPTAELVWFKKSHIVCTRLLK